MRNNVIEGVEDAMIICGVVVSIDQIKTIFGIILLAFQIILILTKGGMAIYKAIKEHKDIDKAMEVINDTQSQINAVVKEHSDDKRTESK